MRSIKYDERRDNAVLTNRVLLHGLIYIRSFWGFRRAASRAEQLNYRNLDQPYTFLKAKQNNNYYVASKTTKLPKFGPTIHIFESQTEQQLLRWRPTIHIFKSQTELLNDFEDDELTGYDEVPDSACSFSFSIHYISIHYNIFKYITFIIKYNFKLWSIFLSFFFSYVPKMGKLQQTNWWFFWRWKRQMMDFSLSFFGDFTIKKNERFFWRLGYGIRLATSLMKFSNYIQMQIIQYIPIHQYIQIHNIYYLQFFMGKRGLNLSYLRSFIFVAIFFLSSVGEEWHFSFPKNVPLQLR